MKIQISNVRAIASAELEVSGITLVLGPNGSGKTALLNTVAACMLGEPKMYGATKANPAPIIRHGAEAASCRITGKDWSKEMVWPDHVAEAGQAPPCDEITMGRVDPAADFDKRKWAAFIRQICGPDAALKWADVEAKLGQAPSDAQPHGLKQMLESSGWDATATYAKNKALDHRRQWETITGDRFGTDKAANWRAASCGLGDSEAELRADIAEFKAKLAKAEAARSTDGESRAALEKEILGCDEQIVGLKAAVGAIETNRKLNLKQLGEYPTTPPLVCPKCAAILELVDYDSKLQVLANDRPSRDEPGFGNLMLRKNEIDAELQKRREELGAAQARFEVVQSALRRLQDAGSAGGKIDVAAAQASLSDRQARLEGFERTKEASSARGAWSFWNTASEVIGPTGLRLEATQKAISKLNPKIDQLAALIFPEHKLELRADETGLGVYFDGNPYTAMVWNGDPNSYKLAIQVLFQLLRAEQLGGDAPVLIDRADTLDKARRNGVLNALVTTKRPAIIVQTVSEAPEVDMLGKAGVGRTYFLASDAKLVPVLGKAQVAA